MVGSMRAPGDRRWYRISLWMLVAAAWAALALWGASPYAGLLDHRSLAPGGAPAAPLRLLAFVAGWTLMTVAMMLPSSLPLVNLFRRLVSDRPERGRLLG